MMKNHLFYKKEVDTYQELREYDEIEYPFRTVRAVSNVRIVVEDTLLDGLQESK